MDKFFKPKSLAVIGASNSPFNLGATILNMLRHVKYNGDIYAVNSKGEDVYDFRGLGSVGALPSGLDLAIILTPARAVPQIVKDCGERGIRNLIIETAGFSEEGKDGEKLQREVNEITGKYGIRFLGPNCLGTIDTSSRFMCFFGATPGKSDDVFSSPGTASYIIQSGAIGALIMDSLRTDIVGVNKLVSIGNKEDIDESDMIEYFNTDNTEVIGLYLESVKDGRKFLETASRSKKPIIAFKVGRTSEGAMAALSHTAGMANNDAIFESACRQAGVIRVKTVGELYSMPKLFTTMPLLRGKRIAIFTNSGAFGGISIDMMLEGGLEKAVLSKETQDRLSATGKIYNAANPVDIGPTVSEQTLIDIFNILLSSNEVDGLLAFTNVWMPVILDVLAELVNICKRYNKPAAINIPIAVDRVIYLRKSKGIPVFTTPEEAVRALVISHDYYLHQRKKQMIS
jgi:acyl-CoA synthetase (NDP forming)